MRGPGHRGTNTVPGSLGFPVAFRIWRIIRNSTGNPDTPQSADKKTPNKSLFSLVSQKKTGKGRPGKTENFQTTTTLLQPSTTGDAGPTRPRCAGSRLHPPLSGGAPHTTSRVGSGEGRGGQPGLSCQQTRKTRQPQCH